MAESVNVPIKYGIIKKVGGWYTVGMTKVGDEAVPEKVQGEDKVLSWLKSHADIYAEYKKRLESELSRKAVAVIVEDDESKEAEILAEQASLEKEALAE